jgi:hypothetical protein
MARRILGISWLNGRFHAAVLKGDAVAASWVSPQPVRLPADFEPALAEAVRQTRFSGSRVVIVLDHGSLLFHVEETPPATGKVLRQLLDRRVAQNRFFEENAAWGRIDLPPLKGRHRVLLALLPQSLVDQLASICASLRLDLLAMVPAAAVLREHLRRLSTPAEETVVLATDLGGSLYLLLGRGDGQVLFSRSLALGATFQSDRAAQEIARTLHYAQQQFGTTVNHLFVFGSQAFASLKDAPIRSGLEIHPSPVSDDPFYFARQAGSISPRMPVNLVSRTESQRQRARRLAVAGLAAALAAATATTLIVEDTVRARERAAVTREEQLKVSGDATAAMRLRQREARHLEAFLRLVGGTNDAPVAELFARYLPTVMPDTMHLTEASTSRGLNGWEFQLKGFIREQNLDSLASLERFEQELQRGIFHAQINDSTYQQLFRGRADGASAEAQRSGRSGDGKPFFVTGRIP